MTRPAARPAAALLPAALLVLAIFASDQATKLWVLSLDLSAGAINVLPFLDITLVWNRGISYGLLQQEGLGRWVLVVVTIAAIVGLSVWLWRAERQSVRLALATIIGGALGNLVDRVSYGAVVDFVHLYAGTFSWYVFNISDTAIVVGAAALVIDGMIARPARSDRTG